MAMTGAVEGGAGPNGEHPPGQPDGNEAEGANGLPLLVSKLTVPDLPSELVSRPRLGHLLDVGLHRPITLLEAPAGWGKSALLSWWVRSEAPAYPVAWLTLESGDEGDQFWSYLRAALSSSTAVGRNGCVLPAPEGGPTDVFLIRLASTLAELQDPIVVILDDFHVVRDPRVLNGLEFLLRHVGKQLRLVIATRADPGLPLSRWRLSGAVTELGAPDLSFTAAETAELLARLGQALPDTYVETLLARTEGWPAGLRLAGLSMREQADPLRFVDQLTGDQCDIADYLTSEVLAKQTDEVLDFLLCSSVLEHVSGSLVDALTGQTDGERILAELKNMNTFVISLDDRRSRFRYHRLFGEFLRAELERQAPASIPELHRRAAAWHAAHELPLEALRHALAARDWVYAADLLAERWRELVLCRHDKTLRTLVPPPPAADMQAVPELALAYAADRLSLGDPEGADAYLQLADDHGHLLAEARRADLAMIGGTFRLAEAQLTGGVSKVVSSAPQILGRIQQADGPADEGARAVALTALGWARLALGELDAAEEALSSGRTAAEHAGLSRPQLVCASRLAAVRALRGQLRLAEETARTALGMSTPGRSDEEDAAHAYLALTIVHYERDRIGDAEHYLDLAAPSHARVGEPSLVAFVGMVRTWLLRARGDLARGYEVLLDTRRKLADWEPPRYMEQWFLTTEANLRTAYGDTKTARELLPSLGDDPETSAPLAVALARVYLRDDEPRAAAHVLARWTHAEAAEPQLRVRLEATLLEALAAARLGDDRQASRMTERVLQLAEPEEFRRVFIGEGPPVRQLLAGHLDSGTAHWPYVDGLLAAADAGTNVGRRLPAVLGEPLTGRELTVLRYLQSILSNEEIASELYVSVNTIKTHLRHIYRKLGAARRREAVRTAREFQLL